jgi:hypothetical protein
MGGGGGLFGGGGGGGTTYNVPQPAAPTPIDYDKMYAAATRSSIATMREQEASLKRLVPVYENMQFNTVDRLAKGLDNEYLDTLRRTISSEMDAARQPNDIEGELQRQAREELALGRSLTPEQERNAQQSARAAFAARGMATGNAASAAEILNRDAAGEARLNQRRDFALGANQLDLARRQRLLGLAGGYADLDPFSRAINPAFQVGTANTSNASGLIGQTFGNSLNAAGNAQSFNANMQAGMYNNWMNNNAAIQAANITGRASQQAGQMAMMGGIAQGAGSFFSDKRMKKDVKQIGKDGVLGLKTYEYRYKGEPGDAPKRVGFMAQDVAKVIPEAVEERTVKGKKRLAIKPAVIGQTLAAALEAQQEAMFAGGYVVK